MDNYSGESVRKNLEQIRMNIAEACELSGRSADSLRIMAVTKTVPAETVNCIFGMGLELIGENRVQEYLSKKDAYISDIDGGKAPEIHFIGHLQTNKVKYIIDDMTMIQSVDSVKLAQEINRLAIAHNKVMDVLCEVNIGGEASKSGVSPDEITTLLEQLAGMEGIRVKGLMTIPPPSESDIFLGRMEELFNKIKGRNIEGVAMDELSMGMTHDYAEAVKHGSTIVRIGTGLFGARNYF